MDIGMLWYDDDPKRTLDAKVERAAAYYRTKYGEAPTTCYVHPSMLAPEQNTSAGVALRPARVVMVNHFWLGVVDNAPAVIGARQNRESQ